MLESEIKSIEGNFPSFNSTRIIKFENKEFSKINEKIQKNESVTSEEINLLWNNLIELKGGKK